MTSDNDDLDDESELAARYLCSACVGESYLRAEIVRAGQKGKCDYCGEPGLIISIGELADAVDATFERHFVMTPDQPSASEYAMLSEGDYPWERKSDPARDAIAIAAEIDEEPAEDVRQVLAERHHDMELAQMGEDSPFDEDAHYAERDIDDIEFQENWRYFEESLKTEARFFNANAKVTLDSVFEGIHEHKKDDGAPVIVEAGPGTDLTGIYRARVFQSTAKLELALKHPDKELGPPPPELAVAGRMNARGISVFYGATSAELAVGEVRPPVGSRVAVARFEFSRTVRLLDVAALRAIYVEGSFFDPAFMSRLELAKFLERLSDHFARPVMPGDAHLDYLPTQAIADYLAARNDPVLDGILYPSVQGDEDAANVALFHKSARVAAIDLPQGTEISASTGMHTEEGWDEHYWVWEKIPAADPDVQDKQLDVFEPGAFLMASHDLDRDVRETVLKIDLPSMQIQRVRAAKYATKVYEVQRHRSQK